MERKLLILDVDETLVFATEQPIEGRLVDFRAGPYSVYRRPHLATYLAAVAEWFDLAVWSSASATYVQEIVTELFPDSSALRFVWACERCTRRMDPDLQELYWLKDLAKVKRLGYRLEHVVMIDDSPEKLSRHYGNHVLVRPFVGDPADRELQDVLPFLKWLRDVENVRNVEKRYWRAFRKP